MTTITLIALPGHHERTPGRDTTATVPAPRPTPALDALCRRHTTSAPFLALLTAPARYRPSIRLDLTGQDGARLARAYDQAQARWGDPRRAFVTGDIPRRSARASCNGP